MALTASDFFLVPMRPERFSILGFGNLLSSVKQFKDSCPDPHEVRDLGVIFTQVVGRSRVEVDCIAEIKAEARKVRSYVFNTQVGFSNTFARAVQDRKPVYSTRFARQELKESIGELSNELQERIEAIAGGAVKRR
jgi:cellulose biosynthesis protein BcsQ